VDRRKTAGEKNSKNRENEKRERETNNGRLRLLRPKTGSHMADSERENTTQKLGIGARWGEQASERKGGALVQTDSPVVRN